MDYRYRCTMDKLPLELLCDILRLACFDDNRTGRSLVLTSKYLRDVADLVRFEAISLYGTIQISRFADMLEKSLIHGAPTAGVWGRIRHLFVSGYTKGGVRVLRLSSEPLDTPTASGENRDEGGEDDNVKNNDDKVNDDEDDDEHESEEDESEEDGDDDDDEDNDDEDDDDEDDGEDGEDNDDDSDDEWDPGEVINLFMSHVEQDIFYSAFSKVIRHISPTLRTLFITTEFRLKEVFPPFPMPNLTDLSITSSDTFSTIPYVYPKLRRIHIDCVPKLRPDKAPVNFRSTTPALEELRITNIDCGSGDFLVSLTNHARYLVSRDDVNDSDNAPELLFPDTLRRVIFQPSPVPYRIWTITPNHQVYSRYHSNLFDTAISLAKSEDTRTGIRVVVLKASKKFVPRGISFPGPCYLLEDARRDWTDVLLGHGKGCWDDVGREDLSCPEDCHESILIHSS
jgi:hypothetical protein